jgi:4-diphosphocytidyl-2-C-methyl-D-erythritol kinase
MSPLTVIEQAYAKVNLCLFVGPTRADGRHELVTLFDSVRLADELIVAPLDEAEANAPDVVVCDGVPGPNLVSDALAGLREAGWAAPPVRVEIWKRIPVAAGMGGGSADAAAMLRCARRLAPVALDALAAIARELGADVPSQLMPGPSLGTGAGERLQDVPRLESYAVLVLPADFALSTPDVYREADRLGNGRSQEELESLRERVLHRIPAPLGAELCVNDLQAAALSLRPAIGDALIAARQAGADHAIVCGSGPTVIGLFWGAEAGRRARRAAEDPDLRSRYPGVAAASPFRSSQSVVQS